MTSGTKSQPATPLGHRLRELREGAGLKGAQLAVQLNTGQNRVSDWECGHHEPTLPILRRYAAVFGMTLSQLLDGVA